MASGKWLDRTQPQTLVIATMLLYINAALALLYLAGGISLYALIVIVGGVAAGFGIANEKKWGFWLGVVVAGVMVALALYATLVLPAGFSNLLNLVFDVALLALLLHPMTRDYRRTWFR